MKYYKRHTTNIFDTRYNYLCLSKITQQNLYHMVKKTFSALEVESDHEEAQLPSSLLINVSNYRQAEILIENLVGGA